MFPDLILDGYALDGATFSQHVTAFLQKVSILWWWWWWWWEKRGSHSWKVSCVLEGKLQSVPASEHDSKGDRLAVSVSEVSFGRVS